MQAEKLQGYIWQNIRKEVYQDEIELYLPFFFGNEQDEPLCLIWNENGVLSDGGRTMKELRNRLGDLTPYMDAIHFILDQDAPVALVGGQNLVVKHHRTCIYLGEEYIDYLASLSWLLKTISRISVVDTLTLEEERGMGV